MSLPHPGLDASDLIGAIVDPSERRSGTIASVLRMPEVLGNSPDAEIATPLSAVPGDPETRRRLASELHDGVGITLSGMLLDMERLKRRGDRSAGLREEIEGLQRSTREVLQSLRGLLDDLRGEPTHVAGFEDLVHHRLERFERQTGIHALLVAGDTWSRRLPARTAQHLLRIVEEALQNVRCHSGARSVEIALDRVGEDAVLTIRDDGRGMVGLQDGQGYGLTGMHEYAVLAGGELRVESLPDRGTAIKVSLPLKPDR